MHFQTVRSAIDGARRRDGMEKDYSEFLGDRRRNYGARPWFAGLGAADFRRRSSYGDPMPGRRTWPACGGPRVDRRGIEGGESVGVHARQRAGKFGLHDVEISGRGRFGPTDQHVVPSWSAIGGNHGARDFAQTPLGAVAGHGVADFLRAGKPDSNSPASVTFPPLKDEAGRSLFAGAGGFQKICPFRQDHEIRR